MLQPAVRLLPLVVLLALPGPLSAGVVLEMETRELGNTQAPVEKTRMTVQGRRLLMESLEGTADRHGDAVLFHGAEGRLFFLDHDQRSYLRMDRERAKAMGGEVASAMDQVRQQMEAQLKTLPPEQRAMVEQMMKQRMGAAAPAAPAAAPKREIRKTSERAKRNGHDCRKVEVWEDGSLAREHWVTDCAAVGLQAAERGALQDMGTFMEEVARSFGSARETPNPMRELEELGGCPVVSIDYDGGRPDRETVLTSSARRQVAARELELPDGYREQAMPGPGRR